jgi:predicted nucleotide-binding protein (sugar kinase/HSP70/actin superfamily)
MQTRHEHWTDKNPRNFSKAERSHVTLLTSGLPLHILHLVKRVVDLAGLKFEIMPEPDNNSLQLGREFGNRGQCNPTYFTVGNLVKHLIHLRDEVGIPAEKIIADFAFVTAGGCGPCRMGMYATEYRKALRDSGFGGFRVLLFTRSGDIQDVLMDGLKLTNKDILRFFMAIMVGDILNTINIRRRPFEITPGSTDEIVKFAREQIDLEIKDGNWLKGLLAARKTLKTIKMKKEKRPIVHIMGEFWAKTTDGEGNYHLFRFIEKEGGVVSNETVTDWLLHQIWRARWSSGRTKKSKFITGTEVQLKLLEVIIAGAFKTISAILGEKISLSDHGALAVDAKDHFDLHVDGGEDHMEVAHHIHIAKHKLADLIISVKPFTCLSSSGVSDGVQSKISDLYPQVEFIAVETNGDSATNFYSRIQMAMQKVI